MVLVDRKIIGTVQPPLSVLSIIRTQERIKVQGQSTKVEMRVRYNIIYACAVECHAAAICYSSAVNNNYLLHRY